MQSIISAQTGRITHRRKENPIYMVVSVSGYLITRFDFLFSSFSLPFFCGSHSRISDSIAQQRNKVIYNTKYSQKKKKSPHPIIPSHYIYHASIVSPWKKPLFFGLLLCRLASSLSRVMLVLSTRPTSMASLPGQLLLDIGTQVNNLIFAVRFFEGLS